MIKDTITKEWVVKILNDLLETDTACINTLFKMRVPCNEDLANHPTCQIRSHENEDGSVWYSVALGGIINAFFGTNDKGYGCIARQLKDTNEYDAPIEKFIILKE
jgi:hypothetical protein